MTGEVRLELPGADIIGPECSSNQADFLRQSSDFTGIRITSMFRMLYCALKDADTDQENSIAGFRSHTFGIVPVLFLPEMISYQYYVPFFLPRKFLLYEKFIS